MLDSMFAFDLPLVAAIQRTAMSPLGAGECQRQLISGCLLETRRLARLGLQHPRVLPWSLQTGRLHNRLGPL